jgi:uncharacterized protein
MRIGILSDTHGFIDDEVLEALQEVDEVWHAGDIGARDIVTRIEALGKPLVAVFGNIDSHELQLEFPEDQFLDAAHRRQSEALSPGDFGSAAKLEKT